MIVDLIAQGVTIVLVIYFGLHLRSKVQTLQETVDTQKVAIEAQKASLDAQAERMKAQTTLLQDSERLNKQVIDVFDPQTQLQREQAYRSRVERDAAETLQQSINKALDQSRKNSEESFARFLTLVMHMMRFIDRERRQVLITASGFVSPTKESLLSMAKSLPYVSLTDEQFLQQYSEDAPPPRNDLGDPR